MKRRTEQLQSPVGQNVKISQQIACCLHRLAPNSNHQASQKSSVYKNKWRHTAEENILAGNITANLTSHTSDLNNRGQFIGNFRWCTAQQSSQFHNRIILFVRAYTDFKILGGGEGEGAGMWKQMG